MFTAKRLLFSTPKNRCSKMGVSKQAWLDATGGIRLGETVQEFEARVSRIKELERRIAAREAVLKDVDELARLKGTGEDDASLV